MKKKLLVVAMALVMIMMTIALVGCANDKMQLGFMENSEAKAQYINVDIKNYEGKKLIDLLKGEKSLGAKFNDYDMLIEVNGMLGDYNVNGKYISIYTTNKADEMEADEYYTPEPFEKDNVRYYVAGKGVSELTISKDIKYLFVLM